VSQNVKAVHPHYIGWFDGHPANLHALPPLPAAQRYVAQADGTDKLLARNSEQMRYAAESAPWRNFYLSGAHELRNGPPKQGTSLATFVEMLEHTPTERFLERRATSIDGTEAAEAGGLKIDLVFSDRPESCVLAIENGVLHHRAAPPAADANATLKLSKAFFLRMMTGQAGAKDLLLADQTKIGGGTIDLAKFFAMIEKAPGTFPIVTR